MEWKNLVPLVLSLLKQISAMVEPNHQITVIPSKPGILFVKHHKLRYVSKYHQMIFFIPTKEIMHWKSSIVAKTISNRLRCLTDDNCKPKQIRELILIDKLRIMDKMITDLTSELSTRVTYNSEGNSISYKLQHLPINQAIHYFKEYYELISKPNENPNGTHTYHQGNFYYRDDSLKTFRILLSKTLSKLDNDFWELNSWMDYMESCIKELLNILDMAKLGRLSRNLMSNEQLQKFFHFFGNNITDLSKFLRLTDIPGLIKQRINYYQDNLIIEISIPLVRTKEYSIYEAHQVPTIAEDESGMFTFIEVGKKFLAINQDNKFKLDNNFMQQCFDTNQFLICNGGYEYRNPNSCESLLFDNEETYNACNIKKTKAINNNWKYIRSLNGWLFSMPYEIFIKINCSSRQESVSLNKTGIFQINEGCIANYNGLRIIGTEFKNANHQSFYAVANSLASNGSNSWDVMASIFDYQHIIYPIIVFVIAILFITVSKKSRKPKTLETHSNYSRVTELTSLPVRFCPPQYDAPRNRPIYSNSDIATV